MVPKSGERAAAPSLPRDVKCICVACTDKEAGKDRCRHVPPTTYHPGRACPVHDRPFGLDPEADAVRQHAEVFNRIVPALSEIEDMMKRVKTGARLTPEELAWLEQVGRRLEKATP